MRVRVYEGEGVSPTCLTDMLALFRTACSDVATIDADRLVQTDWEQDTSLLVFPGGQDIPYDRALRGPGTARIRTFVEEGGHFLGLCAGAYFASDAVVFEPGTPLDVQEDRELKLFPGTAVGTLYPQATFDYDSEEGAHPALVSFQGMHAHLYYNGGCHFQGAEDSTSVDVLGRYQDVDNRAAIVRCRVGRGKAILSGVHFERSGTQAEEAGSPPHVVEALNASETERLRLIRSILDELL